MYRTICPGAAVSPTASQRHVPLAENVLQTEAVASVIAPAAGTPAAGGGFSIVVGVAARVAFAAGRPGSTGAGFAAAAAGGGGVGTAGSGAAGAAGAALSVVAGGAATVHGRVMNRLTPMMTATIAATHVSADVRRGAASASGKIVGSAE